MLRYEKWKERSKMAQQGEGSDDEGDRKESTGLDSKHPALLKAKNALPKHKKGPKFEIKRPEQILKKRKDDEKKAARMGGKGKKKTSGKNRGKGRKK